MEMSAIAAIAQQALLAPALIYKYSNLIQSLQRTLADVVQYNVGAYDSSVPTRDALLHEECKLCHLGFGEPDSRNMYDWDYGANGVRVIVTED